jgi:hypothetical protein
MNDMHQAQPMEQAACVHEFYTAAEDILRQERSGVWHRLLASFVKHQQV